MQSFNGLKFVDPSDLTRGDLDNLTTCATVCELLQNIALPDHITEGLQKIVSDCYRLIPDDDLE